MTNAESSLASRYLARIGASRPSTPDHAALSTLLAAHQASIPFENVDSYLRIGPDVSPPTVEAKLLSSRGGYCMEHAGLATLALRELGFDASHVFARVYVSGSPKAGPRSHLLTRVTIGEKQYAYDAGFGANSPRIPLCLNGGDAPQGAYRVIPAKTLGDEARYGADAVAVVQCRRWMFGAGPNEQGGDEEWMSLWGITRAPVVESDVFAFNWFVSTMPGGLFVENFVASRNGGDWVSIFNKRVTRRATGEKSELESQDQLRDVLAEIGVRIEDAVLHKLWDKICAKDVA